MNTVTTGNHATGNHAIGNHATGNHATGNHYIYPTRLVMMYIQDNCMFCEQPKGPAFTQYVHLEERMGYIYCDNCDAMADTTIKYWWDCVAYGQANYLKHREIQVKRTSGIIERGWELYNPFIRTSDDGIDRIQCYNKTQDVGRWCKLADVLALNPPAIYV